MNLRQLAYGLLSFLPWIPESLYKGTGGTGSAEYCYCIWLRHLVLAHQGGMKEFPRTVAELGPGDSIGVGLAALLSGVQRYIALDAMVHADVAGNLQVFDGFIADNAEGFVGQIGMAIHASFPNRINIAAGNIGVAVITRQLRNGIARRLVYVNWMIGIKLADHVRHCRE